MGGRLLKGLAGRSNRRSVVGSWPKTRSIIGRLFLRANYAREQKNETPEPTLSGRKGFLGRDAMYDSWIIVQLSYFGELEQSRLKLGRCRATAFSIEYVSGRINLLRSPRENNTYLK